MSIKSSPARGVARIATLALCISFLAGVSAQTASAEGLPDGRGYEMVTPVENHNADVFVPQTEPGLTTNGTQALRPFEVSPDGSSITYLGDATVGGVGTSSFDTGNQYLARRSSGGWVQSNIQPEGRKATQYEGFSEDLSKGVVLSGDEPPPRIQPLAPGAPGEGYGVLYECVESVEPCTAPEESFVVPQNPFQALFTGPLSRSDEEFGTQGFEPGERGVVMNGKLPVVPVFAGFSGGGGSGGLLFEANDALLRGEGRVEQELAASVASEIANGEDGNYLYDVAEGKLNVVDVLPAGEGGAVVGDATFGAPPFLDGADRYDPPDFGGVISGDGSRVYWTDLHTGVVYVRVGGVSTTRVSVGGARYWASAADGRYAFYSEGSAGEEGLYRFDAETGGRVGLVAPSGGVQGVVGVSDDGEDVYFVAGGVLAGASSSGVLPQEGQPNLYLKQGEDAPVFIATLSSQDGEGVEPFRVSRGETKAEYGDWQPGLANRTAEVSPGGGGVVFMSSGGLPVVGFPDGYPGSVGVENVYVFDAGADRLFCVSCSESGEAGGASGFLPITWNDTFLPRWMADDGNRVFFDSGVSLVPQDTNGAQDVYEWEREGTGGCVVGGGVNGGCVSLLSGGTSKEASWFIGASVSGDDAFIVTRAQLVPEDQNGADDLYDARVGGERPVSPPACTGTGCQGVPAPPPTFATPPSVTFNGVGNFPPPPPTTAKPKAKSKPLTRAQKLAKALRACTKQPKGAKRKSCEAKARRQFGRARSRAKR